jgi:alkylation response protein AidB-like acyl-CoA dehydrogenase
MATSTTSPAKPKGGSFLIEAMSPEEIFSPEDFTEEHRTIARTTEEFWTNEIAPNVEAIQRQEAGVAVSVLRKAGELGLTSVHLPEKYGGMEMDLTSAMLVAEGIAKDGSYAAWHGGQSGIGALPLSLFGTDEQKQRYLPRIARAELIAAYALSEPQAGSDALAARTRAELSPD